MALKAYIFEWICDSCVLKDGTIDEYTVDDRQVSTITVFVYGYLKRGDSFVVTYGSGVWPGSCVPE